MPEASLLFPENTADRPIFIGGLMKSGTSLMRVLLGQHPIVFGSFETHWYTDPMRLHWNDPGSKRMQYLLEFFELSASDYRQLCAAKIVRPRTEFLDIVMEYCQARAGKQRWVEKTPGNIRHWSLIREQWPSAFLIHVTREYKDCFASWKARRGDDLQTFIDSAKTAYADIEQIAGHSTGNYLEVDYSELVRAPEATMRRLLQQLQLPWSESCARIDTDATTAERGKVRDVLGRESLTAVSLTKPIFSDSIGQWRSILTSEEAQAIESELSPWYAVFGERWKDS
jgi:hypothetical protein